MQSFSFTSQGFLPNDLSNYFLLPPAYWPHNIPFFPLSSSVSFETPKERSPFSTLVPPFSSTGPQITEKQQELVQPVVLNSAKPPKTKKVLSSEQEGEEEEYKVKMNKKSTGCSLSYKKKNTESNIVNQTFSFLSSDRSKSVVSSYFKGEPKKIEEYYRLMTKVKQCSKKYINRKYLKKLLAFETKSEFQRAFIKAKVTVLTVDEIKNALRTVMFNFLRDQSNQTLLTSCKIFKETLPEHFWRKRAILQFLFGKEDQQ